MTNKGNTNNSNTISGKMVFGDGKEEECTIKVSNKPEINQTDFDVYTISDLENGESFMDFMNKYILVGLKLDAYLYVTLLCKARGSEGNEVISPLNGNTIRLKLDTITEGSSLNNVIGLIVNNLDVDGVCRVGELIKANEVSEVVSEVMNLKPMINIPIEI